MDLKKRVLDIANMLQSNAIDAVILFDAANIRYFTELRMTEGVQSILVITADAEITYIVPVLDYKRAILNCWINNIVIFPEDNPNYLMPLTQILQEKIIQKVGIEEDVLTYHKINFLKEVFHGELISVDNILTNLRAVKTEEEIPLIRKAAEIADQAMFESLKIVQEGVREADVSALARYIMEKNGAERTSFPPFLMSGKNAWLPQRFSSDKEISKSELILFDMGAIYKGYCSDLTRTFSLGNLSDHQREIFNLAYYAQQEAIKALKPGKQAWEIDKVARDIISAAGYGSNFPHLTGHGLGMSIHEKPIIDVGSNTILMPNMVVTIEPGIYVEGVGAARVEDMVLITETGCEVLTKTDRNLIN